MSETEYELTVLTRALSASEDVAGYYKDVLSAREDDRAEKAVGARTFVLSLPQHAAQLNNTKMLGLKITGKGTHEGLEETFSVYLKKWAELALKNGAGNYVIENGVILASEENTISVYIAKKPGKPEDRIWMLYTGEFLEYASFGHHQYEIYIVIQKQNGTAGWVSVADTDFDETVIFTKYEHKATLDAKKLKTNVIDVKTHIPDRTRSPPGTLAFVFSLDGDVVSEQLHIELLGNINGPFKRVSQVLSLDIPEFAANGRKHGSMTNAKVTNRVVVQVTENGVRLAKMGETQIFPLI